MKKLVALLFVAVFALSCSNDEVFEENPTEKIAQTSSRLAPGNNVKLHKAWIGGTQRYGFVQQVRRFQVEVKNISYDKSVVVAHKMDNDTWQEFALSYKMATPDGTEIWSGEFVINGSYYAGAPAFVGFANEFAIKYTVNGQEYWDNNNWNNYVTGYYENGNLITNQGMMLRDDINISVNEEASSYNIYGSNASFVVSADVKNLGYSKEVKLVYTTDGWATNAVVPMVYQNSYAIGDYNYLQGVNAYGVERWSTPYLTLEGNPESIEYAVVYKVNGQEYWDNNFGQNFTEIPVVY